MSLYDSPAQIFTAKVIVPLRKTVQELAATHAPSWQNSQNVLSENLMYETPAHRFNVDGGIGNRIVFYGGDIGHAHIDQLTFAMRRKNMRLLKAMTHLDSHSGAEEDGGAQGGTLEEIARDAVGGTTHLGGFTAGYPSKGIPGAVKSDWPADYGTLNDDNTRYNAHISRSTIRKNFRSNPRRDPSMLLPECRSLGLHRGPPSTVCEQGPRSELPGLQVQPA